MHKELCGRIIQKDGGGTWDEVYKLRHPTAKRGCPNCVQGNKCDIVVGAANDALSEGGLLGIVDSVPNRDHEDGEGKAIALEDQATLTLCNPLFRRGWLFGGQLGCRGSSSRRLARDAGRFPGPLHHLRP